MKAAAKKTEKDAEKEGKGLSSSSTEKKNIVYEKIKEKDVTFVVLQKKKMRGRFQHVRVVPACTGTF